MQTWKNFLHIMPISTRVDKNYEEIHDTLLRCKGPNYIVSARRGNNKIIIRDLNWLGQQSKLSDLQDGCDIC